MLELTLPTYGDMSLTLRPALFQSRNEGQAENTVAMVRFERSGLVVAYYNDAEKDINLHAACELGIDAKRGIASGGPVYADVQAVWCGAFLERGAEPVPEVDELTVMRILCGVANQVSEDWKIPMRYRPFNDGEIWDPEARVWRKALACSCTGMGKTVQVAFLLQVKPPDAQVIEKLITPPPEKFADKAVKSVGQRVGSLEDAIGRPLAYEQIRDMLCSSFVRTFGIELRPGRLSEYEEELMREAREKYDNEAWLYNRSERKFGSKINTASKGEALYKVSGGPLLRVTVLRQDDTLEDVLFTGSIHAAPVDALIELEERLRRTPLGNNHIEEKIANFYASGIRTPGLTPGILGATIRRALENAGQK